MSKTQIEGIEFNACECGCGEAVTKNRYRPGHDARHAGMVGREMVRTGNLDLVFQLGTAALRGKANRFYAKRAGQAPAVEDEQAPETTCDPVPAEATGTIKVGRWTYPARMTRAGKVERNTKRDGSGSWEPAANPENFEN